LTKSLKLKIQVKIQGEELRADGKKRDDLQEAIAYDADYQITPLN
jgi:uncharacterized protein YajQ (UPF0234 family)